MAATARGGTLAVMSRTLLLSATSCVALSVGAFATLSPGLLLASKGVALIPATAVWVREVGVLLLSVGGTAWALRREPDSAAMRAFLLGNAAQQAMLAPIEALAWREGTITRLSGIAPNTALHLALTVAFLHYGLRTRVTSGAREARA